jgi:hypothetical protein
LIIFRHLLQASLQFVEGLDEARPVRDGVIAEGKVYHSNQIFFLINLPLGWCFVLRHFPSLHELRFWANVLRLQGFNGADLVVQEGLDKAKNINSPPARGGKAGRGKRGGAKRMVGRPRKSSGADGSNCKNWNGGDFGGKGGNGGNGGNGGGGGSGFGGGSGVGGGGGLMA